MHSRAGRKATDQARSVCRRRGRLGRIGVAAFQWVRGWSEQRRQPRPGTFGDAGSGDFVDDVSQFAGGAFGGAGAGHITDGAKAHGHALGFLPGFELVVRSYGEDDAVATDDFPLVGEVQ